MFGTTEVKFIFNCSKTHCNAGNSYVKLENYPDEWYLFINLYVRTEIDFKFLEKCEFKITADSSKWSLNSFFFKVLSLQLKRNQL